MSNVELSLSLLIPCIVYCLELPVYLLITFFFAAASPFDFLLDSLCFSPVLYLTRFIICHSCTCSNHTFLYFVFAVFSLNPSLCHLYILFIFVFLYIFLHFFLYFLTDSLCSALCFLPCILLVNPSVIHICVLPISIAFPGFSCFLSPLQPTFCYIHFW